MRKIKRGYKALSKACRNHGTCDRCKGDRLHKHLRKQQKNESNLED